MRLSRLHLLPILLLPQFLACGEGSRTRTVAPSARLSPAPVEERAEVQVAKEIGDEVKAKRAGLGKASESTPTTAAH